MTVEDLGVDKNPIHRNKNICKILQTTEYMEHIGTGITRMREEMKRSSLPEPEFDDGWNALKNALDSHFPDAWTDMFYSVYGLYGHEVEKSKDIAKRQNISGCLVTKRMKKMIDFIQQDKNLCDILRDLL